MRFFTSGCLVLLLGLLQGGCAGDSEDNSDIAYCSEGLDDCGICDADPTNNNSTCTQDCAGVWDGRAIMDDCGVCDTNPANNNNTCTKDCEGVWGGLAVLDECGTCDSDSSNDCYRDCTGVWGGLAVPDECGTCDSDPLNDCVQDCTGVWGGVAMEDDCGTCDSDPTNDGVMDECGTCDSDPTNDGVMDECGTCDTDSNNDCVQDCADVWGGVATVDECGTCDSEPTNDCVQDCADVWGGGATVDECGTCDSEPTNDCVQDCADVWGGGATVDECGMCDVAANHCDLPEGMVAILDGTFWRGCDDTTPENTPENPCPIDESPFHVAYLDLFFIDMYEVTAGDYKACVEAGACNYSGPTVDDAWGGQSHRTYDNGRDNHPMNYVNHGQAQTYCNWLGKRLPTEAEWEKAARGTDRRKYPWGGASPTCDLISMGCSGQTLPVGSFEGSASAYGLMDMAGNVWEWTADWYFGDYYFSMPEGVWMNPLGPETGSRRVRRGGSWQDDMYYYRTSARSSSNPSFSSNNQGFRCAQ